LELKSGKRGIGYHCWINGVEGPQLPPEGASFEVEGQTVQCTRTYARRHSFHVNLGGKDHIKLATFKDFISVNVDGFSSDKFAGSSCLMGSFPHGQKFGRDGVTMFDDVDAFGKEWQVTSDEAKLFHEYEDAVQHPQVCVMPAEKVSSSRRRLGESAMSEEQAAIACSHVEGKDYEKECMLDVLATHDLEMAGMY